MIPLELKMISSIEQFMRVGFDAVKPELEPAIGLDRIQSQLLQSLLQSFLGVYLVPCENMSYILQP
jgi:hypothetical protein